MRTYFQYFMFTDSGNGKMDLEGCSFEMKDEVQDKRFDNQLKYNLLNSKECIK